MNKIKITYTVIARSIPEYSKRDGCLYNCTLGYCHESQSIIRVYPVPIVGMKKWRTYRIEVERNKRDTREESWKLSGNSKYENWTDFGKDVLDIGKMERSIGINAILKTNQILPSIEFCNNKKVSIGVVPILNYNVYWDLNKRFVSTNQLGLFEDVEDIELADWATFTKVTKEFEARIEFYGNDGKHDLQYNDWGVYEWYRNFKGKYPINDAFRFLKNKKYALVGNMHHHRNNWIVLDLY